LVKKKKKNVEYVQRRNVLWAKYPRGELTKGQNVQLPPTTAETELNKPKLLLN